MSAGWSDVTYPIRNGVPHWPGQPPVDLHRIAHLSHGDVCNVTVARFSVHTGTHLDAPLHFLDGTQDVTAASIDALNGPCVVHRVDAQPHIDRASLAHLEEDLRSGPRRVLFRTRNSDRDWTREPFDSNYAAIAPDAASLLVELGIRTVGVDYLSVAPFEDPTTTHVTLLKAGVWVVEGLDLREMSAGAYEMRALPLLLEGSDASPIRVLLRERRPDGPPVPGDAEDGPA